MTPGEHPTPPPVAVVDIDGVLADVRHRLRFVQRQPKDWDAFFSAAAHDPLLAEGRAVVDRLAGEHELVYLSGRPERLRADTLTWLQDQHLPAGQLLLRPEGDHRPARVFKLAGLRALSARRRVAVVVDDDVEVCETARRAGFTVFHATWMDPEPTLFEAQEYDGLT